MWPSTPLRVNSGIKAAMMIPAANRIERLTPAAAWKIARSLPRRPWVKLASTA
jgi:hypothetical protein